MQRLDYPCITFDNLHGRRLGHVYGYLQGEFANAVFIPEGDGESLCLINTQEGVDEPDPRIPEEVIREFNRARRLHLREWYGE